MFGHWRMQHTPLEHDEPPPHASGCDPRVGLVALLVYPSPQSARILTQYCENLISRQLKQTKKSNRNKINVNISNLKTNWVTKKKHKFFSWMYKMSYKKKKLNIFIRFKLKKKQHKNLHKPPTNPKPLNIYIYIDELLSHNKSKH